MKDDLTRDLTERIAAQYEQKKEEAVLTALAMRERTTDLQDFKDRIRRVVNEAEEEVWELDGVPFIKFGPPVVDWDSTGNRLRLRVSINQQVY